MEVLAEVEITSEDTEHPIESALLPGRASGWRAAGPGERKIRILFADPQQLRRIITTVRLSSASSSPDSPVASCVGCGPSVTSAGVTVVGDIFRSDGSTVSTGL